MLELIKLDNTIRLDMRYARADNFVGRPVYDKARAFLQKDAAGALVRVHQGLRENGFGLVIYDGYRPWSVTKIFWEVVEEHQKPFVADPEIGSRHNRGCAVDLSLFDIETGDQTAMPSEFDEFNEKSSPEYQGGSAQETTNRDLLRSEMEKEGFSVNPKEWWHFDYKDWERFEISDIPFSEIGSP